MNRELLTQIAKWLEAGAPHVRGIDRFDMNRFVYTQEQGSNSCGTSCCIAGAAEQFNRVNKGLPPFANLEMDDMENTKELLGLSPEVGKQLFYAPGYDIKAILPHQAAITIRHLLYTGKVDWSISGVPEDLF